MKHIILWPMVVAVQVCSSRCGGYFIGGTRLSSARDLCSMCRVDWSMEGCPLRGGDSESGEILA